MPIARIKVNAVIGSNDDVPLNVLVQLANDNVGDETSFLWSIVAQPEGAAVGLSGTIGPSVSFTPTKEGTYLIKLIVDHGLATESTDTKIVGVRQLASGQRIPSAQEALEAGSTGWADAAARNLQLVDQLRMDAQSLIAWSFPGAAVDQVVQLTGLHTLKAGLPGQVDIPQVSAFTGVQDGRRFGIIVGPARTGGAVDDALVRVRLFGLHENSQAGSPAVGDLVYLNPATYKPMLAPSAVAIGTVVKVAGATYWFALDPSLGKPEREFVMTGTTPGLALGESVVLSPAITLVDGQAYHLHMTATVRAVIGGLDYVQTFEQSYALRRDGGLSAIPASGALEQLGDDPGATWTLLPSVGVGPDRILFTFTAVGSTAACTIVASMRLLASP